MRPDQVKYFQDSPRRARTPFGGEGVPGFGPWIEVSYGQMRDLVAQFTRSDDMGPPARVSRDAREQYRKIRYMFLRAQGDVTPHSRDHLETELIDDVIRSHGWATYAREREAAGLRPEPGERAHEQMTSHYLRSCMILAQYTGLPERLIAECGDDQDKLIALGSRMEGR